MKHNGVHTLIRRTHEDRVQRGLQQQGPVTRGEIADRTRSVGYEAPYR
ncbi:MAG: hypothetical protein L0G99_05820 [Propionibacteriales bacterium]|nr:hypothetical protein [Propionibacteriales bacterium]